MLEAVRTVEHKRGRYAEITLNTCAYAGTGNVLKVGPMFFVIVARASHLHEGAIHHSIRQHCLFDSLSFLKHYLIYPLSSSLIHFIFTH